MEMTSELAAAARALELREQGDQIALARCAMELMNEHGFSLAQTEKLTNLPRTRLREMTRKTTNTGGTFSEKSIPALLRLAEAGVGHPDADRLVLEAIDAGTGAIMVARLIGESESWVRYRVRHRERLVG